MIIRPDSKIDYTPLSLTVDGQPWFPMMGEMHFSRYPHQYWEEELCKMKAGGIDVVSLYVIWIHHEEIQGEFDFSGDRNLREFLETVQRCGLYAILRIGPWAHGEARNGGFPDWLLADAKEKGYETRSDDPRYLAHVDKFYREIFDQSKGLFIRDHGPVIGIQIENEYGHCGGFGGEVGEQHMRTLRKMALDIGFDAPIYTATGWGGAVTGGMIPVMGGYCEAPWDQRLTEIEPSGNFVFTKERNDHNIGSDHGLGHGITFDMDKFPYLTAELGGGLQVTHHRRPIASGQDVAAMTMAKIGCGVSLLGYYMYHGGTNPDGKLTTLQESRETGYPNDLPVLSYDFNAPLREYGQMEDTYRQIRKISLFIHDFGSDLCLMPYIPQPGNSVDPKDLTSLRTSVRYRHMKAADGSDVKSGYLFVNNYQRRYVMAEHKNQELKAYDESGAVIASFGKRDIEDGDCFFYTFNMPIGHGFVTVDAAPLCVLHGDGTSPDTYVFSTDHKRKPNFEVHGDIGSAKLVYVTDEEALGAQKVTYAGTQTLIISEGSVVTDAKGDVYLYLEKGNGSHTAEFKAYPEIKGSEGFVEANAGESGESRPEFKIYTSKKAYTSDIKVDLLKQESTQDLAVYHMEVNDLPKDASEVFLHVVYRGDRGELFANDKMVADSFYTGQEWEIGLKRFTDHEGVREDTFASDFKIYPLHDSDQLYLQKWPVLKEGRACEIDDIYAITQWFVKL